MMPTREAIIITEELIKGVQRGFDGRRHRRSAALLLDEWRAPHPRFGARRPTHPLSPFVKIRQADTSPNAICISGSILRHAAFTQRRRRNPRIHSAISSCASLLCCAVSDADSHFLRAVVFEFLLLERISKLGSLRLRSWE
jgi:hypothetical protein